MFTGREAEIAQLESLYTSNRAELFILYGRRRVGKTELLRAFCAGKPHLFFIATLSSDSDQLAAFSQSVYGFCTPRFLKDSATHPGKPSSQQQLSCHTGLWWFWMNLPT